MASKLFSLPTLKLSLHSYIVFLHPTPPSDDPAPPTSNDEDVLRGTVELSLPRASKIGGIEVRLMGNETMNFPSGGWEQWDVMDKVVEIGRDESRQTLEKGKHKFEFSFIIPSSTPGYERSPYGRVFYHVRARAIGAGVLGRDIETSKEILLVINPDPQGGPTSLEWRHEQMVDGIGPFSLSLSTSHLTIGGPLHFAVRLISPPAHAILHAIHLSLLQTITLHSRARPGHSETTPVQTSRILQLGSRSAAPLHAVGPESEEWEHEWVARVPDDDHARPSTVKTPETDIVIEHHLLVELYFSPPPPPLPSPRQHPDAPAEPPASRMKVVSIKRPIHIPSCVCSLDSITLPPYSVVAPPVEEIYECACGQPLERLIAKETAHSSTASPAHTPHSLNPTDDPFRAFGSPSSSSGILTPDELRRRKAEEEYRGRPAQPDWRATPSSTPSGSREPSIEPRAGWRSASGHCTPASSREPSVERNRTDREGSRNREDGGSGSGNASRSRSSSRFSAWMSGGGGSSRAGSRSTSRAPSPSR